MDFLADTSFLIDLLWIAACAVNIARPLVTRNTDECGRIDGLKLIDYR